MKKLTKDSKKIRKLKSKEKNKTNANAFGLFHLFSPKIYTQRHKRENLTIRTTLDLLAVIS